MANFGGMLLTNKGRALQAKAQTGIELKYTRMAIGDGQLGGQQIPNLDKLISEKMTLKVAKLQVQPGGKAVVGSSFSNQGVSTGFYFRELGIFAQDPDVGEILYCYANAGQNAEFIPPSGGADSIEKTIDAITIIQNAQNVSAVIDESLIYPTRKEMESEIEAITPASIGAAKKSDLNVHTTDAVKHITAAERAAWNAKAEKRDVAQALKDANKYTDQKAQEITPESIGAETPIGAQAKADKALAEAKRHTDVNLRTVMMQVTSTARDFDILTTPGYYHIGDINEYKNGPTNSELGWSWSILKVYSTTRGYVTQEITEIVHGRQIKRVRTEKKWSPWLLILDERDYNELKTSAEQYTDLKANEALTAAEANAKKPKYIPPHTDLNEIIEPGDYYSTSKEEVGTMLNVPLRDVFSLSVYKHFGVHQELRTSNAIDVLVFKRNYCSGGWSRWLEILDERDYNMLKTNVEDYADQKANQAEANAKAHANKQVADIQVPVKSVNGKTGAVRLTAADVGAETPSGAQAKANQAEANAKAYVDGMPWQRHKVSADDGAAIDITGRDLNGLVHTGFYKGTNLGNAPNLLHGWGYVEVITHIPGAWVLQKVYDLHADRFYMRRLTDSGWTPWTQDLFQAEANAKKHTNDELKKVKQRYKLTYDDGTTIKIHKKDLNTLLDAGFYSGNEMTNGPEGSESYGYVEVVVFGATDILQKFNSFAREKFYVRRMFHGSWTPWLALATGKDIEAVEQATADAKASAKSYVDNKPWQKIRVTDDAGSATIVTDLNADLSTGWYMGQSMVGAPNTGWFLVEVIRHNAQWCVQNAYSFDKVNNFIQRKKLGGNWTPWSPDLFHEIDSVKQSGVELKNKLAGVINAKGVQASANDTFDQLVQKTGQISVRLHIKGGGMADQGNINVSGLHFRPNIVLVYGWERDSIGSSVGRKRHISVIWDDSVSVWSGYYGQYDTYYGINSSTRYTDNAINNDGFTLRDWNFGDTYIDWEAWG